MARFQVATKTVDLDKMTSKGVQVARLFPGGHGAGPCSVTIQYLSALAPEDQGYVSDEPVLVPAKKGKYNHPFGPRPVRVTGKVVPVTVSAEHGRGATPLPCCGWGVDGLRDENRGHVMAMQLGGTNSYWNIVPQWGIWQQQQAWRKMEVEIFDAAVALEKDRDPADAPSHYIRFTVDLRYQGTLTGNSSTDSATLDELPRVVLWSFPVKFLVSADLHEWGGAFVKHLIDPSPGAFEGDPIGVKESEDDEPEMSEHDSDKSEPDDFDDGYGSEHESEKEPSDDGNSDDSGDEDYEPSGKRRNTTPDDGKNMWDPKAKGK